MLAERQNRNPELKALGAASRKGASPSPLTGCFPDAPGAKGKSWGRRCRAWTWVVPLLHATSQSLAGGTWQHTICSGSCCSSFLSQTHPLCFILG